MAKTPDRSTIKSAYELALERLGERGIRPPAEDVHDDSVRDEMAAVRRKAAADLAQLEILHRDRLEGLADPAEIRSAEERYVDERRRIESQRDERLARLRERD